MISAARLPLLALFLFVAPSADGDTGRALPPMEVDDDLDADYARQAVQRGEILPLEDVLVHLRARVEGDIIEVELDTEDGLIVYEIDVLSPRGELLGVELDARTGEILEVEVEDDDDD